MPNEALPRSPYDGFRGICAGNRITLEPGHHTQPIVIANLKGTRERPIVIQGVAPSASPLGVDRSETVFLTQKSFTDFRVEANRIAADHEANGNFPGLYHIADEALVTLQNCQWVVLKDLTFENCWPTAVYLDNCQNITLQGLHITGGTFAIGAFGANTRHLSIRDCNWIQDVSGVGESTVKHIRETGTAPNGSDLSTSLLWQQLNWLQIHGYQGETGRLVDIEHDARAFDGDFFRAWSIAGYVTLSNNIVTDAFNAVHFFNQASASRQSAFSRNVLIEDNWFVRIRDNAVEPEGYSWNWTVRHNKFVDCYAPFSLETGTSGYFYIYGNLGWNLHRPGPPTDERISGRVFKLDTRHKAVGPHYVIHNSWMLRGPIFKKKRLSQLRHWNNAIGYYEDAELFSYERASPFGPRWHTAHDGNAPWADIKDAEKYRFTKDWAGLDIECDSDVIGHPDFPDRLREADYPIGPRASGLTPNFASARLGDPHGLKLVDAMAARPITLLMPDQSERELQAAVVGAWQGDALLRLPEPAMV